MIVLVAFEWGYLDPFPMRPGHYETGLPPLEVCPVEVFGYDFDGPFGQRKLDLWAHHILIVFEIWLDDLCQAVLGEPPLHICVLPADFKSGLVCLQVQDLIL